MKNSEQTILHRKPTDPLPPLPDTASTRQEIAGILAGVEPEKLAVLNKNLENALVIRAKKR